MTGCVAIVNCGYFLLSVSSRLSVAMVSNGMTRLVMVAIILHARKVLRLTSLKYTMFLMTSSIAKKDRRRFMLSGGHCFLWQVLCQTGIRLPFSISRYFSSQVRKMT